MYPNPHARPTSSAHRHTPFSPLQSHPDHRWSSTINPMPRPAQHPYLPRRIPLPGQVPVESHLDRPYAAPPSSQPARPDSQNRYSVNGEGRETSLPRPTSSLGLSISDHPSSSFRPASIAEAHVERWQPPPPSLPNGKGPPRSAAQVYQASREPKASKAPEILANLACESPLLSSTQYGS